MARKSAVTRLLYTHNYESLQAPNNAQPCFIYPHQALSTVVEPRVEFVQNRTQNKEHGAHRLLSASLEVMRVPAERSCE